MDGCLVACVHGISQLRDSAMAISHINLKTWMCSEKSLVILAGNFHDAADVVALPSAMQLLAQN